MAKNKTTAIVRGCARKSIVLVSKKGDLMVRKRVAPTDRRNRIITAAEAHALEAKKRERKEKFVREVFAAAREKRWGTVLSMVNLDNVNEPDRLGRTLIMVAAMQDEIMVMERLVKVGAFKQAIDDVGRNALFYAVKEGTEWAPKWLVENGVDWKTALETAVKEGAVLLAGSFKIFGATDGQIAELRKKYPKPTRVLSDRARMAGGTANDIHALGLNHEALARVGTATVGQESTPAEANKGGKESGRGASFRGC